MSKFLGRRYISSGDGYGGGVSDHGLLTGLSEDDHLQYLISSAIRIEDSPTSGINKLGSGAGDVFSLVNAGSGAALYVRQTGTTSDADAAVDIDNTGNVGRGLSVFSSTTDPSLPLVQLSALSSSFDEPVLYITHADSRGLAIDVRGDGYLSGMLDGPLGVTFTSLSTNPIELGDSGVYVEGNTFYFVDSTGTKHTFSLDERVRISATDTTSGYLSDKLIAGPNIELLQSNVGGDETIIISSSGGTGSVADGYFPFIEVDELVVAGNGSGTLPNTSGSDANGSITRNYYNNFTIGDGTIDIRGLTLRSTIDADLYPTITYDVIKNAELINSDVPNTILSGGIVLVTDQPTTETETFISGNRKDGEIQFTTGAIDLDDAKFDTPDGNPDGYFYFVFSGDHTADTKTIVIQRFTVGPRINTITFEYPECAFAGADQTAVRAGQSFDVEVNTNVDGYADAVSVQVDAGDAIQSTVVLSETFAGSGIWTGTVVARAGQPNGLADINITATDAFSNSFSTDTTETGDQLVFFDNDFPVIETFNHGSDIVYPDGQGCLKWNETADAYMTASDFTEILYYSPNGRFTIDSPTSYSEQKSITWDQGSSGIEENADILGGLSTTNMRIRARKASNCSETTRNMQIRLDDTPPRISSIRWRRNNIGSYNLTSPTLGIGTHGIRLIFNDPLTALPSIQIDGYDKGTLSAVSGTVPGTTFYVTHTVDSGDVNGCSTLSLLDAINCSNKQPLDVDPIDGTQNEFCIDVITPEIIRVEIDVDLVDGYWNDGYDGYNDLNDDINNTRNIDQACEVDFSSAVQSITAPDIVARHNRDVYVSVEVKDPIEAGDTCSFDASPWGASSSLSVAEETPLLYQGPFTPNLGSARNDDQSNPIGRASIWHPSGNDATVTDLATNTDTATNTDILSANGIDDIASYISFTSDGTVGGTFQVSTDSFRAFVVGREVSIVDDNTSATIRTVTSVAVNGTVTVDGGSLAGYTVAQNARAVPLGVTNAEVQAWDVNNGLVKYIDDSAFTQILLCDWANPEAFSQHLTDAELEQNNSGTIGVDLFRAAFWGSKLSVPNTNGGTEANPTGVANSKYVWRSKRLRLTTNPTGVQGSNLRFMVFGFSAGTSYRNVNITATSDWDQNANRFDLNNNDSQLDIRICVDDPYAAGIEPITNADWHLTTDFQVSPQAGFKFGKDKDINIAFDPPSTDVVDKDIYVEITLTTNSSGKAPQLDMFAFAFLA